MRSESVVSFASNATITNGTAKSRASVRNAAIRPPQKRRVDDRDTASADDVARQRTQAIIRRLGRRWRIQSLRDAAFGSRGRSDTVDTLALDVAPHAYRADDFEHP